MYIAFFNFGVYYEKGFRKNQARNYEKVVSFQVAL